jgi:hypothetical protein
MGESRKLVAHTSSSFIILCLARRHKNTYMGNQENSPATGSALHDNRGAKKKPPKLAPEAFLENWRNVVNGKEDPVRKLRPMMNAGFAGDVTNDHVSILVQSLRQHPGLAERIALSLAWRDRFGKLNSLSKKCLIDLRSGFASSISFEQNEFVGYRAARDLQAWAAEHAPRTPPFERDTWFRRFVVCLLKDTDPKVLISGLIASAESWMSSSRQTFAKKKSAEQSFVRGIVQALGSPTIGVSRLDLALSGIQAVEEQFQDMLSRESSLQRQIRTQQDEINDYENRLTKLDGDLAQVREESSQRNTRIAELAQSLAESQERYRLLDQHWRGVSEQELAKQSGSFREKVSQELLEALLALDRDQPNLEMALRRLRRIDDILKK